MIGGGGKYCARGDHGIGITSENYRRFLNGKGYDFGDNSYQGRITKKILIKSLDTLILLLIMWFLTSGDNFCT